MVVGAWTWVLTFSYRARTALWLSWQMNFNFPLLRVKIKKFKKKRLSYIVWNDTGRQSWMTRLCFWKRLLWSNSKDAVSAFVWTDWFNEIWSGRTSNRLHPKRKFYRYHYNVSHLVPMSAMRGAFPPVTWCLDTRENLLQCTAYPYLDYRGRLVVSQGNSASFCNATACSALPCNRTTAIL
jgi:hypothetical protein